MSLIIESTSGTAIPFGKPVVMSSGKVREFDSQTDAKTDIIGIVMPKSRLSGRQIVDGEILYSTESLLYTEFLQYALDENNEYIVNPNFDPDFNYITDDKYQCVCVRGIASLLSAEASHPNWVLINGSYGASSKLYLVR